MHTCIYRRGQKLSMKYLHCKLRSFLAENKHRFTYLFHYTLIPNRIQFVLCMENCGAKLYDLYFFCCGNLGVSNSQAYIIGSEHHCLLMPPTKLGKRQPLHAEYWELLEVKDGHLEYNIKYAAIYNVKVISLPSVSNIKYVSDGHI